MVEDNVTDNSRSLLKGRDDPVSLRSVTLNRTSGSSEFVSWC